MELSGTSFSAPIVSGIAALILGRHPDYTSDQVKGALMLGTKPMPRASYMSVGVGEANARRSVEMWNPPNPNRALNAFIVTDPISSARVFDAASWADNAGDEPPALSGGVIDDSELAAVLAGTLDP